MLRRLALIGLVLGLADGAFASSWMRGVSVVDVRWYTGNGGHGYISTSSNADPEGCNPANPSAHRYFDVQTPGHEFFLSLALTAMAAGHTIDVLLDGCHSIYPRVIGIIVRP